VCCASPRLGPDRYTEIGIPTTDSYAIADTVGSRKRRYVCRVCCVASRVPVPLAAGIGFARVIKMLMCRMRISICYLSLSDVKREREFPVTKKFRRVRSEYG
jgi:hypothetical protein